MEQAERRDRKHQLVQPLPALAQPLLPAIGGGDGQRHQPQQRHEADGEVESQHDLADDPADLPLLVQGVQPQVQQGVERRRHPQHAAQQQHARPVQHRAGRGHGDGQQ
ncbi:MAG: hypothetical protein J0I30_12845, partial [Burkholderiales bacterium]|nr:hypothetical protein [Burkholderiales bacterium]